MESLEGLKRTALCADLSEESLGQEVTLMGWCQVQRDLGGLIFISLRDRSGIMQLVVDEESPKRSAIRLPKSEANMFWPLKA
jgi:aspartyl-tRNA synthetase